MKAVVAVLVVLAGLALAAVIGGEIVARRTVDERLTVELAGALGRASQGGGFASVTADEQGWTGPDLLRGRLSRVDAVATDGDIGGLPIQRLSLTAMDVSITTVTAASVTVLATVDATRTLDTVGDRTGLDVASGEVTVLTPDSVRLATTIDGAPGTLDVRLAPDGAGGAVADVVAASVNGVALDPAALGTTRVDLVDVALLPAGLAVTAVEVAATAGGPQALITLTCAAACTLGG